MTACRPVAGITQKPGRQLARGVAVRTRTKVCSCTSLRRRLQQYDQQIERHLKGSHDLEVGAGTTIRSHRAFRTKGNGLVSTSRTNSAASRESTNSVSGQSSKCYAAGPLSRPGALGPNFREFAIPKLPAPKQSRPLAQDLAGRSHRASEIPGRLRRQGWPPPESQVPTAANWK